MNFQFYQEKLIDSEEYQNFKKENPTAFMCSGFFVLDREKKNANNRVHFDFWLPKFEKMYSFKLDGKVEFVNVENFDKRGYESIGDGYDFDLEDFEKLIISQMEKDNVKGKIQKLLFSLQKLDGKDFLVTTVFLNNLGLLKINIDIGKKEITSFEKKSFLDMLKIVKK